MFKRLLLILMAVLILTGCMPAPIDKKQTVVPEPEKSMVTRSLSAVGNTFRINKKLKLAKKGEPIVVAYVGSSIFYDKSENSVSDLSFEYIKTFLGKKAHLKKITSGVEDSTSILGNILLKRDVLSKKPDIIFLDYAVFDTPNQDCREAFEAIIRNSLACENEPQVVILLNTNSDGSYKQDFMEQVGRYYNLPIINVATAIQPEISSGRASFSKFYTEDGKLNEYGKQTVAKLLDNYILQASKIKKDKSYIVPQMMYRNSTSHNIKFLDAQNIQSINDGSYFRGKTKNEDFPNKIEYMTNTGNLPFTFKLDANNVFLIMPVSTARNDVIQVEVNGKKIAKIDTKGNFDNDVPQAFKIFSSSKTDKVTVSIKLVDEEEVNTDFSQNPEENDKEDMHENMQKVKNAMNTPENDFEFWGIAYTKHDSK